MTGVTDYEYDDLRLKIQERLKSKEGWGDAFDSTVGQTLIDINADAADILSYMLERRSQEGYQSTARLRSSVVAKASETGYRPFRSVSSTGTLQITLLDADGNVKPVATNGTVVIEEGSVATFDGEVFVTTERVEIVEGESQAQVPIEQGVIETQTFDPAVLETLANDGFILFEIYEDIAESSISVVENGTEYTDILEADIARNLGSLSFAPASTADPETGAFYDIRYVHNGMRIQFGDDLFGRRPVNPVVVSFVRTKGGDVRIVSLNNEFQLDQEILTDDLNLTPPNEYEYQLLNVTPVTGGRGPETTSEIKINAPLSTTSNNRAVNIENYDFWAKRSNIGGIIDAKAFTERELNTLLYNINNVYISYLTETGDELTAIDKQAYADFIKERDVALSHIVPLQAEEIQLGMDVRFQRTRDLPISNSELYDIIRNFLLELFKRQEGSIGNRFEKSDIIRDFYDITTRSGGADFKITQFVDIDIKAYQGFSVPLVTEAAVIKLATNITVNAGDEFTLTIDGVNVTVVAESGDDYVALLNKMRDKIFIETNLVANIRELQLSGGGELKVLTLATRDKLGSFTVTADVGTFAADTTINYQLRLVQKSLSPVTDILLRGSISIIDSTDSTVYTDDGNGNWVDSAGNTLDFQLKDDPEGFIVNDEAIDYITGKIFLPFDITNGDYNLVYKQDRYDNFEANENAATTLIEPKVSFEDTVETFTQIRLL